jgi:hypothetical protein
LALIKQYIARGSHINSDGAAVYQGLFDPSGNDPNDFGFFGHDVIIHSDSQWMDEDEDGEMVTTNDNEIIWRYLKENISYYRDDGDIDTHVSRYLYFYRFLRLMSPSNRFHKFLTDIGRIYCGAGGPLTAPESDTESE